MQSSNDSCKFNLLFTNINIQILLIHLIVGAYSNRHILICMATYQQKSRRNLLITTLPAEQVYHESPDENEQQQPSELLEIE